MCIEVASIKRKNTVRTIEHLHAGLIIKKKPLIEILLFAHLMARAQCEYHFAYKINCKLTLVEILVKILIRSYKVLVQDLNKNLTSS